MNKYKTCFVIFITLIINNFSQAKPLSIVSSIYPIQQITNTIYGQPTELIVKTNRSPHTYFLKPSDARAIESADLLIWVGPNLLTQLTPYVQNRKKPTLTLIDIDQLHKISGDHDHGHESDHDHLDHDHGHESKHDEHADHDHSNSNQINPHIWLSTENAKIIAKQISLAIIQLDPKNKKLYQKNLADFEATLDQTKKEITTILAPVLDKKYYVYHEAYDYFEAENGLNHQGVIRIDPSKSLRSRQVSDLKKKLLSEKSGCIFQEPQFSSQTVNQLIENTNIKASTLDPIGYTSIETGFPAILTNLANSMRNCMSN